MTPTMLKLTRIVNNQVAGVLEKEHIASIFFSADKEDRSMRKIVINLERSRRRLEKFQQQNGTTFARFSAVDGSDTSFQSVSDYIEFPKHFSDKFIGGTLGCFVSHVQVWEQIAQYTINDVVAVFEDDVNIANEFDTRANALVSDVEKYDSEWDIIVASHSRFHAENSTTSYYKPDDTCKERGLLCVLIRPSGAKRVLRVVKPFVLTYDTQFHNIDIFLASQAHKLNLYYATRPRQYTTHPRITFDSIRTMKDIRQGIFHKHIQNIICLILISCLFAILLRYRKC